jgi:hypothetical protein
MNVSQATFAVLRMQYHLARFPLKLVEDRIIVRLGNEAPARVVYERSLGKLDAIIGNALGDHELAEAGAALVERSKVLARAAELDAKATGRKRQADADLKSTTDAAIEQREKARAAKEQTATETRTAAQERKQEAAQQAQKRVNAAAQRAHEVAAERKEQVESAKRQDEQRIGAVEKAATEAAKSKLDDAQDKRNEAASKRAVANRVEELADAESEKRQAKRVNGRS